MKKVNLSQKVFCSLRLQSAVCSLRSAVCGLQSAVCGLQSAVCSLQSAVCSLQSAFSPDWEIGVHLWIVMTKSKPPFLLIGPLNTVHISCAVTRQKVKNTKGKHANRWGNSKLTYISSKRRLQHDFHRQHFRKLIKFKKSTCKTTIVHLSCPLKLLPAATQQIRFLKWM